MPLGSSLAILPTFCYNFRLKFAFYILRRSIKNRHYEQEPRHHQLRCIAYHQSSRNSVSFEPVPPANQNSLGPQSGPIFTKKFIQPTYNQKARYLPISQKYPSHKCCNTSDLQKSQNLRTDSMSCFTPKNEVYTTA